MGYALYVRSSDNVANAFSSLTVATENATYPKSNLYDGFPHLPYKATTTGATITFNFASSKTLQAVALINHNLAGATVTLSNNSGLSVGITIPANTLGGRSVNAWKDLRGVANTSATQWVITITGASANVAIGEIVLGTTLRTLDAKWGVSYRALQPTIEHRTAYKVPLKFGLQVRYRVFKGTAGQASATRDDLLVLNEAAQGPLKTFLFILDEADNDPALVTWSTEEFLNTFDAPDYEPVEFEFEEWCSGLPL